MSLKMIFWIGYSNPYILKQKKEEANQTKNKIKTLNRVFNPKLNLKTKKESVLIWFQHLIDILLLLESKKAISLF